MTSPARICRCGHDEEAHSHWRGGSDCGRCGPVRCLAFRPTTGRPPVSPELRRLLLCSAGVVVLVALGLLLGKAGVAAALAVIGGTAVWLVVRD